MTELPPAAMAALVAQAPQMGELGAFFLRCFGAFDFDGIELALPQRDVQRRALAACGRSRADAAARSAPRTRAATRSCTSPAERVLFTGDILFSGAHPIAWAGPVSNWIAACERILALDAAGDRAGPRAAERAGGRARAEGLLRVPLRAGAPLPRRRHDAAAGGALARRSTAGPTGASASAWSSTSRTSTRSSTASTSHKTRWRLFSRWPSSRDLASSAELSVCRDHNNRRRNTGADA